MPPVDREVSARQRAQQAIWYERGRGAWERGDWADAAVAFQQVEDIAPGYQDAAERLVEARQLAESSQVDARRHAELAAWYEQGATAWSRNDWSAAAAAFLKVEGASPGYRDAAARFAEAQARLAEARQQQRLATLYDDGVGAASRGDWAAAAAAFEQIECASPGYRDTAARLADAQARLDAAEQQARLDEAEQQPAATELAQPASDEPSGPWLSPRQRAEAARQRGRTEAEGPVAPAQAAGQAAAVREPTAAPGEAPAAPEPTSLADEQQAEVAAWYEAGLIALGRGDWANAIPAFEQVESMAPGFRDVAAQLAEARRHVPPEQSETEADEVPRAPDSDLQAGLAAAQASLSAGRADEAVVLLQDLAVRASDSAEVLLLLARARAMAATHSLDPAVAPDPGAESASVVAAGEPTSLTSLNDSDEDALSGRLRTAMQQETESPPPAAPATDRLVATPPAATPTAARLPQAPEPELPPEFAELTERRPNTLRLVLIVVAVAMIALWAFQCLTSRTAQSIQPEARESPAVLATQAPAPLSPTAQSAPSAAPTPIMTTAELFATCEAAVAAGAWRDALVACERVRDVDPDYPGLASALAKTYARLGQEELLRGDARAAQQYFDQALQYLDRALAAPAPDSAARQQRERAELYEAGRAALAAGDWATAVDKLQQVFESAPDYGDGPAGGGARAGLHDALLQWGRALLGVGAYAEAQQRCEQAVAVVPGSLDAAVCRQTAFAAILTARQSQLLKVR